MKKFRIEKVEGKVQVIIQTEKPVIYDEHTVPLDTLKKRVTDIDEMVTNLQNEKLEVQNLIIEVEKEVKKL